MFRTELIIAPATDQLPRTGRVLTMGSCFADSIGARLALNKIDTLANPFGTVFQPLALARLLRAAAGEDVDWQQHLVEANGRWQSYDLHSSIGASSPVELLQRIQELVRRTGDFLRQADMVLITLGTAWAYRLRETGELVSNCHKKPAELFERELLTPDDIINALAETHAYLRRANPNLRFVLTVSPVRHVKDTLPLNSVSKSVLRLATHFVSDLLPGVAYFPAYELLTDDLRDYRFYAADMLHPTEVAEDYIWEKFARTYFDAEFGRFRKDWAAIRQALGHRPLHEAAPEHRQFLENTLARLEQMSLRRVNLDAEIADIQAQLAALPVLASAPEPEIEDDDEERIDIGLAAGDTVNANSQSAPAALSDSNAGNRPPRLSPEEFRTQRDGRPARGRRDGRGRRDDRTERVAAHDVELEQDSVAASYVELRAETEQPDTTESGAVANFSAEENGLDSFANSDVSEPAKKKKRRSRGGAKRTARKYALQQAELAQEQAGGADAQQPISTESTGSSTDDETPAQQPRSSVITKSVPVKRGGRRGVPTQPLYATPPVSAETPAVVAGDSNNRVSVEATSQVASESSATVDETNAEDTAITAGAKKNNRRKKSDKTPAALDSGASIVAATSVISSNQLSSSAADAFDSSVRENAALNTTPTGNQAADILPEAAPAAPAATERPARKSNRAKRAVSGGRAVKPDVDTPVIPPQEDLVPRTQVAAGRMTGSSASLVEAVKPKEPAAPKKKAAPKAKPTTPKAPVAQKPIPAAAPAAPALPKVAQAKKAVAAKPPKAKSDSPPAKAVAAKAAPTRKEATKAALAKTAPAKAASAKAPRKAVKPKPAKPE